MTPFVCGALRAGDQSPQTVAEPTVRMSSRELGLCCAALKHAVETLHAGYAAAQRRGWNDSDGVMTTAAEMESLAHRLSGCTPSEFAPPITSGEQ